MPSIAVLRCLDYIKFNFSIWRYLLIDFWRNTARIWQHNPGDFTHSWGRRQLPKTIRPIAGFLCRQAVLRVPQTNEQRQVRVASPQGNSENSSPSSEQIKIRFWMWCNQRLSPINQRLLFSSLCSGQDWLLEWQLEQNPLIQWCLVDTWDEIQWWLYSTIADAHAPWNKTVKSSRIAQLFMWYCRKRLLFAKAGAICGHSYGFSQAPMHGWFQIWNPCFIARRSVSGGVFPPCMGWMCFCLKSWDLTEEQIVNSLWMLRLRDLSFWVFYSCFMA